MIGSWLRMIVIMDWGGGAAMEVAKAALKSYSMVSIGDNSRRDDFNAFFLGVVATK